MYAVCGFLAGSKIYVEIFSFLSIFSNLHRNEKATLSDLSTYIRRNYQLRFDEQEK